jgi:sporulation protein YlmC with PRC-barrel domain
MKYSLIGAVLMSLAFGQTVLADRTPVAGRSTLGADDDVVQKLAYGWSLKKSALDEPVYNDKNEKIGKVEDVIIDPDKELSYFIVGTGGFLGIAKHDVAIPAGQMKRADDKYILAGATKDKLKRMAEFQYGPAKRAD